LLLIRETIEEHAEEICCAEILQTYVFWKKLTLSDGIYKIAKAFDMQESYRK
jgi:hypothetical protein